MEKNASTALRNSLALGAAILFGLPLAGCSGTLDPQGPIGRAERLILFDSLAIMLAIVVPLVGAIFAFAWWFRASNECARYRPEWAFSGQLELVVWAIPAVVVTFLGGIAWFGSQALDPYKALSSPATSVEVEVVSLDWKWLFLYPQNGTASVNQLVIPAGVPVHFRLTSSGVMNSFFVPQLGSQIYAMAGMTSQLNLQGDRVGTYEGLSAQFSGAGFADMHFVVRVVSPADYAKWLAAAKTAPLTLDGNVYAKLVQPSRNVPPTVYKSVPAQLFDSILRGDMPVSPHPPKKGS